MNGENYVVKHNKLIEAKGKMTLMEQKILRTMIAEIQPKDHDFAEYQIDVREFQELSGGHTRKDLYNELKDVSHRLMDRKIEIEDFTEQGKKRFFITRYISSAEYISGEGHIKVSFDPKLKPYLLQLKEQYTKYQLKYVMQMRSAHALRLYELLKQYESLGKRKFVLEDFKQYLGIEEGYAAIKDLEKRVLKPSQEEINELTDISIEYRKICQGRGNKVVGIEYSIKKQRKKAVEAEQVLDPIEKIKMKSGLVNEAFTNAQISDLYEIAVNKTSGIDADPCEYIRLNHMSMLEKDGIKSKISWLKKALKEDWAQASFQIKMRFDVLDFVKGRDEQ